MKLLDMGGPKTFQTGRLKRPLLMSVYPTNRSTTPALSVTPRRPIPASPSARGSCLFILPIGGLEIPRATVPSDLTPILRRIDLIGQPHLGEGFDLERISLCAVDLGEQRPRPERRCC